MKEKLTLSNEIITINNHSVKKIYGGFGDGQPCILAKQVAELHGYELREINQIINNNLDWFDEGIDIIDLKKIISSADDLGIIRDDSQQIADIKKFLLSFYSQDALNASKHVYIFSQQGYTLQIKLLKSDLAKQIYKQMVREYFVIKAELLNRSCADCGYKNLDSALHQLNLEHTADNDSALERMLRKRVRMLEILGFDKAPAAMKAIESIREGTGIDLTKRLGIRQTGFGNRNSDTCPEEHEIHTQDTSSDTEVTKPLQKEVVQSVSQAPGNYRGWKLIRRGKNNKGEMIYNLVRKINGKRHQKYLGVWNQLKADQIIDTMNQEFGLES